MSDSCCGGGNEQRNTGHERYKELVNEHYKEPAAVNGLFDDVMTSVLKALVSNITSWNQTWKSTLGSDYCRVIDVFEDYYFIYWLLATSLNIGGYLI